MLCRDCDTGDMVECVGVTMFLSLLLSCSGAPESLPNVRNAHILILGQSNAGCHGERAYQTHTGSVFAHYRGDTVPYADPVRGTTTWEWGEGSWAGIFGDAMVEADMFKTVTFTNISRGGSPIQFWSRQGYQDWLQGAPAYQFDLACTDLLDETLQYAIDSNYPFTHIIWMQGESNAYGHPGTQGYSEYKTYLLDLVSRIREFSQAPMFISRTTLCSDPSISGSTAGGADADIWNAQTDFVTEHPDLNVFHGPDTDAAAPLAMRIHHADGCHLSWEGQQAVATAWLDTFNGFINGN